MHLMGPFNATSEHNYRSSVKIWGLVFKCPCTTAVEVFVLDTSAYSHFSSWYGHPFKLYIDEGGQLIQGCKEMKFDILDFTNTLAKTKISIVPNYLMVSINETTYSYGQVGSKYAFRSNPHILSK